MCDKNTNPFASLLTKNTIDGNDTSLTVKQNESTIIKPSKKEANEKFCKQFKSNFDSNNDQVETGKLLDKLIADVFGITLSNTNNKISTKLLVFIDEKSIESALFERLLLTDPKSMLIPKDITIKDLDEHTIETRVVPYLFESYCRLQKYRLSFGCHGPVEDIKKIILRDMGTALEESEIFNEQNVSNYL